MHSSEARELEPCAHCGADVATEDRAFVFGDESILCFRCSIARHGRYDEQADRWDREPDVADLLERDVRAEQDA